MLDMNLDIKTRNKLARLIGESPTPDNVSKLSEYDIVSAPRMGVRSVTKINKWLSEYGLRLQPNRLAPKRGPEQNREGRDRMAYSLVEQGKSYKDIASLLGCSYQMARNFSNRGKRIVDRERSDATHKRERSPP